MKYTAKGTHNRHFELFDASEASLGKLDYTSWFSIKSAIALANGKTVTIEPANIWHTSVNFTVDGEPMGTLKLNWKMHMVLSMANGQTYIFKRVGFFNSHFGLFNEAEYEMAVLDQKFQLSKLSFNYTVETDDNYKEVNDPAMVLLMIYCANFMHSMGSGGAV